MLDDILPLPKWSGQRLSRREYKNFLERQAKLERLIRAYLKTQKSNVELRNRISLVENQMEVDSDDWGSLVQILTQVGEITEKSVTDVTDSRSTPLPGNENLYGLHFTFRAGKFHFLFRPDHNELFVERTGMFPRQLDYRSQSGLTNEGTDTLRTFVHQAKHPKRWRKLLSKRLLARIYTPKQKKGKKASQVA